MCVLKAEVDGLYKVLFSCLMIVRHQKKEPAKFQRFLSHRLGFLPLFYLSFTKPSLLFSPASGPLLYPPIPIPSLPNQTTTITTTSQAHCSPPPSPLPMSYRSNSLDPLPQNLRLKVTLKQAGDPPLSRTLSLPSQTNFEALHWALQAAFGWGNYPYYVFRIYRGRGFAGKGTGKVALLIGEVGGRGEEMLKEGEGEVRESCETRVGEILLGEKAWGTETFDYV